MIPLSSNSYTKKIFPPLPLAENVAREEAPPPSPHPSPRHTRQCRVVHLSGAGATLLRGRHREGKKRHFLECEQNHDCFTCRNASSLSLVSSPAPPPKPLNKNVCSIKSSPLGCNYRHHFFIHEHWQLLRRKQTFVVGDVRREDTTKDSFLEL